MFAILPVSSSNVNTQNPKFSFFSPFRQFLYITYFFAESQ